MDVMMAGGVGVPVRLILNPFDRGIAEMGRKLQAFSRRLPTLLRIPAIPLHVAGGVMQGLGQRGGLATIARGTFDAARDMENAVARLQRATGAEGASFRRLNADLREVATTLPGVTLENTYALATMGAKMGITNDQIRLFTRDMAKVSVVLEDIPIEEAATRFSRLLNIYHRGSDEAIRMASALNKLDLSSNASAREILDITNRIAPVGSFMGMSLPKTMALATSLRETGMPVETSGIAMGQVMGRMADRKFTGNFAQIAGMDVKQFRQLMGRDVLGAIEAVEKGLRGMSREKGIEGLNRLGLEGQRVRGVLLALGAVIPQLNRHVRDAEREWASMDSIQGSFARAAGLTDSQLTLMHNSVRLLAADLGRAMLPVVRGFSRGLVDLSSDIREWANRNGPMFEAWGRRVGRVFDSIGTLWRNFPLFVEYGTVLAQEKWEQFVETMSRSWKAVWETIKYQGRVGGVILGNLFKSISASVNILIDDVLSRLGLGGGGGGVGAWAAGLGAKLGKMLGGGGGINLAGAGGAVGAGVGGGGVPRNLPMQHGPVFGGVLGPGDIGGLFSADELGKGINKVDRRAMDAAWRHLLDPLPNRAGQLGALGARIAERRAADVAGRAAARRAQDAADAAARRAAELDRHTAAEGRRGFGGNPPRRGTNQWRINRAIEDRMRRDREKRAFINKLRKARGEGPLSDRERQLPAPPDIQLPRPRGAEPADIEEVRRTNEKLDRVITLLTSLDRKGFSATYG